MSINLKPKQILLTGLLLLVVGASAPIVLAPSHASAAVANAQAPVQPKTVTGGKVCGDSSKDPVATAIDIGCRGQGNPIMDMLFAIIRLLSNGVGIVVIGSIIVGGIQYTTSAGDPQATAKAVGRIRATLIALGLYIFAYPLLNYLIPMGFFK